MAIVDVIRERMSRLLAPGQSTDLVPVQKQAPTQQQALTTGGSRTGALTTELGSTGLRRVGGVVVEEWLPQLFGDRGIRQWREMSENDGTIGAVLFAIEMLIRQVEWTTEAASEDQADKDKADFLRSCMNDLDKPWVNTVAEILTMLPYGWSVHELVYKVRRGPRGETPSKSDDGRVGWKRIPLRGQDTLLEWVFTDSEEVEAFVQTHPVTFRRIEIPREKFVHFKTRERRGPESISVLRNAYRPWVFKKRLEEIEAIGIERDMAGLPVAYVPAELLDPRATPEQQAMLAEIKKIVRGVKINEQMGLVFPQEYDHTGQQRYKFELLSAFGSKARSPDPAIRRYKQDMAMTVLADFILLGHEKVGSYALSDSKTKIFASAMGAWLDTIADTLTSQAVPRLFALNGLDGPYPKIVHGDIETPNLDALSKYVGALANAGALTLPDEKLERHLRRAASLPEQGESDVV